MSITKLKDGQEHFLLHKLKLRVEERRRRNTNQQGVLESTPLMKIESELVVSKRWNTGIGRQ